VESANEARIRETEQTEVVRRRYDRIAPWYDCFEAPMEHLWFRAWRRRVWSVIEGDRILEVGVGTGKNLPFHPPDRAVVAVDLSERMLAQAKRGAAALGISVELTVMDVQSLGFPDGSFDTAIGTFVFCSVPEPCRGLAELRRVLRPGGKLILLEHVRADGRWAGRLLDALDPIVSRLIGAHVNRRTVAAVAESGFRLERVEALNRLVRLIEARNPEP
jgi:ubiquinone/menaquinone biosynthesis C-methylase UbiE